jgi:hypothetical protein
MPVAIAPKTRAKLLRITARDLHPLLRDPFKPLAEMLTSAAIFGLRPSGFGTRIPIRSARTSATQRRSVQRCLLRRRRRKGLPPGLRHPIRCCRRRGVRLRRHAGRSHLGNHCGRALCHLQGYPRRRPLGTSCCRWSQGGGAPPGRRSRSLIRFPVSTPVHLGNRIQYDPVPVKAHQQAVDRLGAWDVTLTESVPGTWPGLRSTTGPCSPTPPDSTSFPGDRERLVNAQTESISGTVLPTVPSSSPPPDTPSIPGRRRQLVNATVPLHLSATPYREALMARRGRFHRRGQEGWGAAAHPQTADDRANHVRGRGLPRDRGAVAQPLGDGDRKPAGERGASARGKRSCRLKIRWFTIIIR